MRNNSSLIYSLALIIGDFFAILSAFLVAYLIRVHIDTRPLADPIAGGTYAMIFFSLTPFWLLIFAFLGLYKKDVYDRRFAETVRLFIGSVVGIMTIITVDFAWKSLFPARLVPVYALGLGFGLLIFERTLLRTGRKLLFKFNVGINNVLIIGNTPATTDIANLLSNTRTSGYRIVGMQCNAHLIPKNIQTLHLKTIDQALELVEKLQVYTIIQTELFANTELNEKILATAQEKHLAYKFIPAYGSLYTGNNEIELFHNYPVIAVHRTTLIGWGRIAKRIGDILGAVAGLALTAPIFLIVAIIIKLTDPKGPVFYKHERVTRFGGSFNVYKLRSMYWKYSTGRGRKTEIEIFKQMGREDLVEEWLKNQKVTNDPRIMPIGRFIRKTSLDELPQLWNALKGELSLIGPRAITQDELKRYADSSSLFLSIKPGITGLWQVSGRNNLTYEERIKLDLFYVQHWSILLDLKILYKTVVVMLSGKGQ